MRPQLPNVPSSPASARYERKGIVAGGGPKSGAAPKLDRGRLLRSYVFEWRFSAELTHGRTARPRVSYRGAPFWQLQEVDRIVEITLNQRGETDKSIPLAKVRCVVMKVELHDECLAEA